MKSAWTTDNKYILKTCNLSWDRTVVKNPFYCANLLLHFLLLVEEMFSTLFLYDVYGGCFVL